MKINELKVIEEGFFGDVGDAFASNRYREQDPKKRQAGIQKLFLDDFINDFKVDLNDNIKAGVIGGVAEKTKEVPGSEYAPQGQSGTQFDPNMQTKLNEYAVFNSVIESIINEQQKTPMNTWIVKWFNAYMQGVNWQQERSTVEKIATEIAKSYNQNKSLTGLDQLANLAWEITSDKKGFPGGFDKGSSRLSTEFDERTFEKEVKKYDKKDLETIQQIVNREIKKS
jgi:hypothetical protein